MRSPKPRALWRGDFRGSATASTIMAALPIWRADSQRFGHLLGHHAALTIGRA